MKIKLTDLKVAPKCEPDGSFIKVILFTSLVGLVMLLETWATLALGQYIAMIAGVKNIEFIKYIIYIWQLLSYILSPMLCSNSGKVAADCFYESAENKWKQAKPVTTLYPDFYPAGKVLWWGLLGMVIFAPAIWKMQWAGKTIFNKDSRKMIFQKYYG